MTSYLGVPPVKEPSWKPGMIPGYFWLGGIAAGAWLVVSLDDLVGTRDAALARIGRYTAAATLGGGTVLLILDLGRPERFLNMLRVFRPRSAMNLGAWGLSGFGGAVGLAVARQVVRDLGGVGDSARPARSDGVDRVINLVGLLPGLFVGSYTGTLLSSTSAPAWAARTAWLSPLFAAAAASSGTGALLVVGEATAWRGFQPSTPRRLAHAQAVALVAEVVLTRASEAPARRLPSHATEPRAESRLRRAVEAAGALGLGAAVVGARALRRPRSAWSIERTRAYDRFYGAEPVGSADRADARGGTARLAAGVLALAGGLALRLLTTRSGRRSAATPEDTWEYAR